MDPNFKPYSSFILQPSRSSDSQNYEMNCFPNIDYTQTRQQPYYYPLGASTPRLEHSHISYDNSISQGRNYHGKQQNHFVHSISLDSFYSDHLYQQEKQLARLKSAITASHKVLGDIDHQALEREEELTNLAKIEKNPSKEDCDELESYVKSLQNQLQSLYNEFDDTGVSIPGESPVTSPVVRSTQEQFTSHYENIWDSQDILRERQMLISAPSRRILDNPIDDSLSKPMSHWK